MKQFFEQYGGVALGILALLVLIAMITPVGNIIKTSLQGTVHKFSTSINAQTDDAMNSALLSQENAMSSLPIKKGEIIKLSDVGLSDIDMNSDGVADTFRVLWTSGNQAKLFAMESYKSSIYGPNNTYFSSSLASEMDNYYNALPSEIKSKIVEQNISQGTYDFKDNATTGSDILHINAFAKERYYKYISSSNSVSKPVFALSVQDIIDYAGDDTTGDELSNFIFDTVNSSSKYIWLQSAYNFRNDFALLYDGDEGYIGYTYVSCSFEVRPTFVLDLSSLN